MKDKVIKPDHYAGKGVEHFDAVEAASQNWPQEISPHLTHMFSYLWRCGAKDDPAQDLAKIIQWAERARKRLEK